MKEFYNDVTVTFCDEGKSCLVKQNTGLKYSVVGAILFSDNNGWVKKYYTRKENEDDENSSNFLHKITYKKLIENTIPIFKSTTYPYTYKNNTFINSNLSKILENPLNSLFDVKCTYKKDNFNSNERYTKYNCEIGIKDNFVYNVDNTKCEFDGIAILAIPYKPQDIHTDLIFENQEPVIFALEYFPTDKIYLLPNQEKLLKYNVELQLNLNDEIEDLSNVDIFYSDGETPAHSYTSDYCDIAGLHLVNDGSQNTTLSGINTLGGVDKLFISTLSDSIEYEPMAKLNIMTDTSSNVPQILLGLSTTGDLHKWTGNRLKIQYTSADNTSYFGVTEVTGLDNSSSQYGINTELFGINNILTNSVNCSILKSNNNNISNVSAFNLIHSDYNVSLSNKNSNISLYDSNSNKFHETIRTTSNLENCGTINSCLFNSNNNNFQPSNTTNKKSGFLRNYTLIHSNYNLLSGHNQVNSRYTLIDSNYSYINTEHNNTIIGGKWNCINETSNDTIAIGTGLINSGTSGDKIILGSYNKNSTDENEILIVGDGHVTNEYLNTLTQKYTNYTNNAESFKFIIDDLSKNSVQDSLLRHNIFTVNNNGYITIADKLSNSARYGYDGISAYAGGSLTAEIKFNDLYNAINNDAAAIAFRQSLDDYQKEIELLNSNVPSTFNFYITSATDLNVNTTTGAWSSISANCKNNTIINIVNNTPQQFQVSSCKNMANSSTFSTFICSGNKVNQLMFIDDADMELSGFIKID